MARQPPPPPPPLVCVNCGDDMVIAAEWLPVGPLCADCGAVTGKSDAEALWGEPPAPKNENPAKGLSPKLSPTSAPAEVASAGCDFAGCTRGKGHSSFHTTIAEVAKRLDTLHEAQPDRQSPIVYPGSFRPAPGAEGLVIEVEEWILVRGYKPEFSAGPVATPTDLNVILSQHAPERRVVRFMVILEWQKAPFAITLRDIGPGFGELSPDASALERTRVLVEAMTFARAESRRLKANGPFGYKPAREIPEVRHESGTKPSVDESAHDPRPPQGSAPQAAEVAGETGEDHGA